MSRTEIPRDAAVRCQRPRRQDVVRRSGTGTVRRNVQGSAALPFEGILAASYGSDTVSVTGVSGDNFFEDAPREGGIVVKFIRVLQFLARHAGMVAGIRAIRNEG
eukprot:CAMPEP_0194344594 /NCGR_PEP_ID=MMETSP0171-20130528/102041_1 /TAXON_ID=218684 /ORGANISM="Corethron pennatum, Strain L29A3" /LENGTH=104 /DNA_ID=CAMNT_0039111309 /DNA_START=193 /DNA_END=508 /DNA_ORIENTATION=+